MLPALLCKGLFSQTGVAGGTITAAPQAATDASFQPDLAAIEVATPPELKELHAVFVIADEQAWPAGPD